MDGIIVNPKRYIILDTCSLYTPAQTRNVQAAPVIKTLKKLTEEGYSLAISEFSVFEKLKGLWRNDISETYKFLQNYEWKTVSSTVLLQASILSKLYEEEAVGVSASDGDKIVAATAILEGGLVLTINHKDFPNPFFIAQKELPITYQTKERVNKTLDFILYKPTDALIRRISEVKQSANHKFEPNDA